MDEFNMTSETRVTIGRYDKKKDFDIIIIPTFVVLRMLKQRDKTLID